MKIWKNFREAHKHELHLYQALEFDQNSNSNYKGSCNGKEESPTGVKRKQKEVRKYNDHLHPEDAKGKSLVLMVRVHYN